MPDLFTQLAGVEERLSRREQTKWDFLGLQHRHRNIILNGADGSGFSGLWLAIISAAPSVPVVREAHQLQAVVYRGIGADECIEGGVRLATAARTEAVYVNVYSVVGGLLLPAAGFVEPEAELVDGMADELVSFAREHKVRLEPDLTDLAGAPTVR